MLDFILFYYIYKFCEIKLFVIVIVIIYYLSIASPLFHLSLSSRTLSHTSLSPLFYHTFSPVSQLFSYLSLLCLPFTFISLSTSLFVLSYYSSAIFTPITTIASLKLFSKKRYNIQNTLFNMIIFFRLTFILYTEFDFE